MRLIRPVLAGLALGTVLPVTAASAATGVTAAGSATSTATIATVAISGLTAGATTIAAHSVKIGTLSAGAQTVTSTMPSVTFTPLTVDGSQIGSVTVTPANSPTTVGAISTGALPLNVLSATSPAATLSAGSTSTSKTSGLTTSLGTASILGMPVTLNGGVTVGSVTDGAHSQAGKSVTLTNVALPSLSDVLAALGIDVAKLPAGTLNGLLSQLPLNVSSAQQTAIDSANSAIDSAQQAVTDQQAVVDTATTTLADAAAALDAALSGADLTGVTLPSGMAAPLDHTDWDQLDPTTKTAIETLNSGLAAVAAAYDTAKSDLATAQTALDGLQATLASALAALGALVDDVLAGTPLVKVGATTIATKAAVSSAKVASITGSISGVQVLGQDVLAAVTGNSTLDAAKLAGDVATQVNSAISSLTSTLSNVLSAATGATGLVVPAPSIQVMVKSTKTGVNGAYGTAQATLTALSISLGSVTVPDAFALAGAGSLAGIAPITGGFKTSPLSVKVGEVVEAAQFRGASTPSGTGSLPATGIPSSLGIVALVGSALAFGTFRFLRAGWR